MRPNYLTAWQPTDASPQQETSLLDDPTYVSQEKFDGIHVLSERNESGVLFYNKAGALRSEPDLIKPLINLPPTTILDGERLPRGPYIVYDVLWYAGVDCRAAGFDTRDRILEDLVRRHTLPSALILKAPTARTTLEKMQLMERLRIERAEGVIYKHIEAPYVHGKAGGIWKVKFVKECDVIVLRRQKDTKHSFEMFVFNEGEAPVHVGSVHAQGYYDMLKPGQAAVAEVRYLYSSDENKLIQPRIWRLRTDKKPLECTFDQIIRGKRYA